MIKVIKKFKFPILIGFIFIFLAIYYPETAEASSKVTWEYFIEIALIMPPVFLLMGLIEVWVPKNKIEKWLGNKSGILGSLISIGLGTLPTGPLYIAFPIAASLLKKGASISNIVLFLGTWAALKIPQLLIEIEFLGFAFTGLRFVLTLIMLVAMGGIMQLIIGKKLEENLPVNNINS